MSSSKIVSFLKMSWQRKSLFLLALAIAMYSWVLFTFFKSRARFSSKKYQRERKTGNAVLKKASEVKWAITNTSRIIFWKNVCRHQAYQAVTLFKYYKVPYQVMVGFKRDDEGLIIGHVWTTVEQHIITGFCNPEEYTIISTHEGH
jgi:hypothetical protein